MVIFAFHLTLLTFHEIKGRDGEIEREREFEEARRLMVETQLIPRGIRDERVLGAFLKVPRHKFVPEEYLSAAYDDHPLPIGEGQTISQPYMVAIMTECLCLKGDERVLEIGTGSGYQAAILCELAKEVYTIERFSSLAERARQRLAELGYKNVRVIVGNGTEGLVEFGPYDGIIVTAAAPDIPESLTAQLKEGGRLVIPVGSLYAQTLVVACKTGKKIKQEEVCQCVFVPLVGKFGWSEDARAQEEF